MNKHTVLLGPDWFDCACGVSYRWLFVPTLLLIASISVSNFWMEELRFFSLPFRFFFHLVHFALLYCYVSVGMVDQRNILGKVVFNIYPFSNLGFVS